MTNIALAEARILEESTFIINQLGECLSYIDMEEIETCEKGRNTNFTATGSIQEASGYRK